MRLGHRRGGTRIWRSANEEVGETCVRRRWSGYMDFMFWGAFTWDAKCKPHIWEKETPAEKKAATKEVKKWNEDNEKRLKEEWELETAVRRLNIVRNPGGKKPEWKFTAKTGKQVRRKGKGGIDWWRYGRVILEGILLPFAKECQRRWGINGDKCLVQEDNAPSHAHKNQATVYNRWNVQRMLWPANSPDLNMIEPAWPTLKRRTTVRGAPRVHGLMKKSWLKAWDKLEQERIQRWICRIPRHIEKVLALHGGNEYKEGRLDRDSRTINGFWKGHRIKGQLSRLDSIEGAPDLDTSDVDSVDIELEDDVEDWSDVEGWREDDEEDEEDEEGRDAPAHAHRVPRPQVSMIRPVEGVVQRPQESQGDVVTARIPATKVGKPLK